MAEQWGFQINSSLASQHLTDAKYVQGGYIVVNTEAERDDLPVKTGDTAATDGVVVPGSLVYVSDVSKSYRYNGTSWVEESGSGSDYSGGTGISVANNVIGLSLTDSQKATAGQYIYNAQASAWSNITFTNSFSSTYTDTSMSGIKVGLNITATSGITLNNNLFRLSLTDIQLGLDRYYGYNPKNNNWTPVATSATVGALSELATTDKTSIVSAINSLHTLTTANASKIGSVSARAVDNTTKIESVSARAVDNTTNIKTISAAMGNQVTYSLSGTTLTITSK